MTVLPVVNLQFGGGDGVHNARLLREKLTCAVGFGVRPQHCGVAQPHPEVLVLSCRFGTYDDQRPVCAADCECRTSLPGTALTNRRSLCRPTERPRETRCAAISAGGCGIGARSAGEGGCAATATGTGTESSDAHFAIKPGESRAPPRLRRPPPVWWRKTFDPQPVYDAKPVFGVGPQRAIDLTKSQVWCPPLLPSCSIVTSC